MNWKLWAVRSTTAAAVLYFSISSYGLHRSVWDSLFFAAFMLAFFALGEWHQKYKTPNV